VLRDVQLHCVLEEQALEKLPFGLGAATGPVSGKDLLEDGLEPRDCAEIILALYCFNIAARFLLQFL